MTEDIKTTDPKTVVIQAWQAFASRDPDRIAALLHEDAEWIAPQGNATAVALGTPAACPTAPRS